MLPLFAGQTHRCLAMWAFLIYMRFSIGKLSLLQGEEALAFVKDRKKFLIFVASKYNAFGEESVEKHGVQQNDYNTQRVNLSEGRNYT